MEFSPGRTLQVQKFWFIEKIHTVRSVSTVSLAASLSVLPQYTASQARHMFPAPAEEKGKQILRAAHYITMRSKTFRRNELEQKID